MTTDELGKMIDHTLLKAQATSQDIKTLCEQAKEYGFATVCVHPVWVPLAHDRLIGTGVAVGTVVGFPYGTQTTETKAFETRQGISFGAEEIDMVLAIGQLKEKQYDFVRNDIQAVVKAAEGATVKVIIETGLLTQEEKVKACELAVEAGAAFVKTSTGFNVGGATVEDVSLMKKTVGDKAQVKASGGVRSRADALAMISAGATRIGTSSGISIVR